MTRTACGSNKPGFTIWYFVVSQICIALLTASPVGVIKGRAVGPQETRWPHIGATAEPHVLEVLVVGEVAHERGKVGVHECIRNGWQVAALRLAVEAREEPVVCKLRAGHVARGVVQSVESVRPTLGRDH